MKDNSDDMNNSIKKEEQAMLLVCLNNAGVKAFERGDLQKSLKLFCRSVHAVMATLNIPLLETGTIAPLRGLSKKMTRKVVKSQSKSFQPNKIFQIRESRPFGTRRRRTNQDQEQPQDQTQTQTDDERQSSSNTYTYQKVFRIRASNSDPILDQTTPEQLTGIVLLNLAVCHHLEGDCTASAQQYYELAYSAATLSGDLLPQVVIWNNLLQLHYDRNDVDTALECKNRLQEKISEIIERGLLRKLKKVDRRGFLLNVMLFTNFHAAA
eukprot:CAMPEP_0119019118 /NCGR_PEP_ID=MMETSP1176-20130426/21021_1 /TAXON_ID=265551 /ORGANISM="Synedropsis recta cf, Strain CCMP1620" /LENGTH=266 /DNA_ID=CAMNT_0006973255 /DNA_START=35 /DNA_END=831 /DNA_ORIENTATION=-